MFSGSTEQMPTFSMLNIVATGEENKLKKILDSIVNKSITKEQVTVRYQLPGHTFVSIVWELFLDEPGSDAQSHIQWIGINEKHATGPRKNILELWERYEAYEYSAEGLWKIDLRKPVSISLSPDEIIAHCRQHAYLADCNDNMARMYGFAKAGELIGTSLDQLMDLEDAERLQNLVSFIKNKFLLTHVETKEFDRFGNVLYFLNNMTGIVEKGMLTRIWGTQQDITELKKTEERLQQSELFYRNLIADSSDGILLTNNKGCINFASGSVEKILGYNSQTLIDKNIFEFLHPEDMKVGVSTFFNEMDNSADSSMIRVRLRHQSGEWLWCLVRGHNMFANPHVNAMLIYFCDDTIGKKTEDALIESEQKFRHLIHNLTLGVILVGREGEILIYNKATANMFDVSETELIGTSLLENKFEVIHDDGSHFLVEDYPVARSIKTKQSVNGVVMGIKKPNNPETMWLLVGADPVLNGDNETIYVISSFTNITEQKRLAEQVLDQQKKLMQATIDAQEKERREIGRELHDNISQHITTTRLYLEVAKEKASGDVLAMINQAHKGLLDTVKEMRQLSQSLVPPSLSDIGLVASIEDLCNPLTKAHACTITFEHHLFNEDLLPDNMKLMLFRIIQEQINNIIRHSAAENVTIAVETLASRVVLTITDDGKGFDKTAARKGIGFVNIATRANLFGGNLNIDTSPGNGCKIRVEIPLLQAVEPY
jgi:PAS domain S-box-containing protein